MSWLKGVTGWLRGTRLWTTVLSFPDQKSRGTFPLLCRGPIESGWFLKRTMVDRSGESTPRKRSSACLF